MIGIFYATGKGDTQKACEYAAAKLGAEVKDIDPSGPCHDSGLRSGDLITRINDTTITESAMLVGEVRTYLAGETVQVEVLREGRLMTFDITLAAVPKSG